MDNSVRRLLLMLKEIERYVRKASALKEVTFPCMRMDMLADSVVVMLHLFVTSDVVKSDDTLVS